MWKKLRQQLEKNWRLKGWLIRRDFRRNLKELDRQFDPLIANARVEKNKEILEELDGAYQSQYGDVVADLEDWQSSDLLRRARKHFVHVPDRAEEPDFWEQGQYSYPNWELSYKGTERLKRDVRDAQRARNDEWRKWVTLAFAVVATALSVWSLVLKTKQPDPCQRNYYRNDAGECVFALPTPKPKQAELKPASPAPKSN